MSRFSIGALALSDTTHISLGPRHPTQSGLISGTGEIIDGAWSNVDIRIGYGHRSAEKLFEVRDYRSAIMLADRHDWLSAFSGELAVTMAIERAMRLNPPPRAVLLRTLLAEVSRIHSHLSYLSYVSDGVWDTVEAIRGAVLAWSGNRVHPMLSRVGGLAHDLPAGWRVPLDDVMRLADDVEATLEGTDRFRGLAVLDADACIAYGLSGPVARAAGLDLDRRRSGYLAYGDVYLPTPLRQDGDAHARLRVLADELRTSSSMVERLLDQTQDVPPEISVRLARRLKVPEGEHVSELEAPWGIAAVLLVSRGGSTPWRLALRTPSFANLSALGRALEGTPETAIADAVASIGYSVGDADK